MIIKTFKFITIALNLITPLILQVTFKTIIILFEFLKYFLNFILILSISSKILNFFKIMLQTPQNYLSFL